MKKTYQTQDERIIEFIDQNILPALTQKDLDYKKVVQLISIELGMRKDKVEKALDNLIAIGKMSEIHILTIPDDKIGDWLQDLKKYDEIKEEAPKELQEAKQEDE